MPNIISSSHLIYAMEAFLKPWRDTVILDIDYDAVGRGTRSDILTPRITIASDVPMPPELRDYLVRNRKNVQVRSIERARWDYQQRIATRRNRIGRFDVVETGTILCPAFLVKLRDGEDQEEVTESIRSACTDNGFQTPTIQFVDEFPPPATTTLMGRSCVLL